MEKQKKKVDVSKIYCKFTDREMLKRYEYLYKTLNKTKQYIDLGEYYLYLLPRKDNSQWVRWFHRGTFQVEMVVVSTGSEPNKNIAPFVLFSNKKDAIKHLMLLEQDYLFKKYKSKSKGN